MRLGLLFCLLCALVGARAYAQPSTSARLSPAPKAWLGVAFADAPSAIVIEEVIPDSPADLAGVLVGDLIYAVGEQAVQTGSEFQALIQGRLIGDEVLLKLQRRGQVLTARAELTAHLDPQELIARRLVDKRAPEFSLSTLSGTSAGNLEKHRGKVVVLHFWSTRCLMCTDVFASLAALQAENLGELEVLAVTADASSVVESYLQTYKLGVTVLHDPGFGVHAAYRYDDKLPTTVVIGRDGYVRHADTGENLRMDDILLAARRSLRERPSL